MNKDQEKKLLEVKLQLEQKFGSEAVKFASEVEVFPPISSGSLSLDFAVGGGLPQDRVVEFFGEERSGKTTLGLIAMVNFLDENPERSALILDVEHKLTIDWVETLIGTERMSRVVILWPRSAEQATDMYTEALESGQFCFCLFDSIGGAPTRRVMFDATGKKKSAETGNQGGNALAITRFAQFSEIYSHVYRCCTVGINQMRDDMDGWNRPQTPGGRGWKHACSLRLWIKRVPREEVFDKIDGEDVRVGFKVVARAVKNHLPGGVEDRLAYWWFYNIPTEKYGFGIDRTDEIIRLSVATGLIQQRGAWYYHQAFDTGKIQSLGRLNEAIQGDLSLRQTLTNELFALLKDREVSRKVAFEAEEEVGSTLEEEVS